MGFWADAAVYVVYTLNRTPNVDGHSPFFLRYGRKPKLNHLRPFGNPCVVYRKRNIKGKLQDAGVRGNLLGYGYVDGKKGYRVRIEKTHNVVTSGDVSFSVFKSKPNGIDLLAGDDAKADAVVTTPCKPDEVAAVINDPLTSTTATDKDSDSTSETSNSETGAADVNNDNANDNDDRGTDTVFTYTLGAKVAADWRGHGEYYPAIVTGVHKAGANDKRTTYDLVYEADGEPEPNVGNDRIRPRNTADFAYAKCKTAPCGHALMTDCNPQYLADVPDLAREHVTPKSYGQAAKSKQWRQSMDNELDELEKLGVYEFVATLPNGKTALGCLWVYKVKCGADGEVTRYKSRLTVNGKHQKYGIDYTKTFSPVAFATSIRLLFIVGLFHGYHFRQLDIKCAFLYGELPKDQQVYMRSPPGAKKQGYWLLKRSLYGLRQSPMLFNEHLNSNLEKLGFASSDFDPCFYIHTCGALLVVVVDDMILAAPTKQFADKFYNDLKQVYDLKDLGTPTYVIGVRVGISTDNITLQQDRYIDDLFTTHSPGSKPTNTPAAPGNDLCLTGIHGQPPSPILANATSYRSLVGGLMYTLITRPDVAVAVSICARYLKEPRQAHLDAALRILRYLHHTRTLKLIYNKPTNTDIVAFVDSSWANDMDTRRSRYGYAVYVGRCLVGWVSKLHHAIALSTAEAEYSAATELGKFAKWVHSLLAFIKAPSRLPIPVFEDNSACRSMASCRQVSGLNKHFELKQHYIRQLVHDKVVQLLPIPTAIQIADVFTKPTPRPVFEAHRSRLLNGLPLGFPPRDPTEGGC